MDSQKYLESYGWKKGEPLQKGGLKKPILVSHKFDLKGIGHHSNDTICWWETVFDGQLKSLDVNKDKGFENDEKIRKEIENSERKKNSPLYQMFVKGSVLMGTIDKNGKPLVKDDKINGIKRKAGDTSLGDDSGEQLIFFDSDNDSEIESDGEDEDDKKSRKRRKQEKREKREKKEKKRLKKEAKQLKKVKKEKKEKKKSKKSKK